MIKKVFLATVYNIKRNKHLKLAVYKGNNSERDSLVLTKLITSVYVNLCRQEFGNSRLIYNLQMLGVCMWLSRWHRKLNHINVSLSLCQSYIHRKPLRLLMDHAHGAVYLSSSLTARHLTSHLQEISQDLLIEFITARCTLVQSAVLRSHVVCPSVCPSVRPSVTLVDQDHIGRKSWKLIPRTLSPTPSLFVAQRPSTYSQGNMGKFWGD